MGSSILPRMFFVPCEIVYRPLSVRSTCMPRSATLATIVSATNSTASTARADSPNVCLRRVLMTSIRFLGIQDDRVGHQPHTDRQGEVHDVAQLDHALGDGAEV